MIIAVDFDGVIHDHKHSIKGKRMGAPVEGTDKALRTLKARGHKIVVLSVWGDDKGKPIIADFMKYYGLLYDEITNIKIRADIYLDDHAVRFTTWEEFLNGI